MSLEKLFPAITPYLETIITEPTFNTKERVAAFVSQLSIESKNFTRTEENLKYSAKRLLEVFPKYYIPEVATMEAMQPEKIANRVYGKRMGNSLPGDGYLYRGRGLIQVTGKNNYTALSKYWNCTLEECIKRIETPSGAIDSAYWFWITNDCNKFADKEDIVGLTKRINGGSEGLDKRMAMYKKVKECLSSL
jgi:putative chitinase